MLTFIVKAIAAALIAIASALWMIGAPLIIGIVFARWLFARTTQ